MEGFGELLAFGWIGSAILSALLGQTKNRNGCLWFLVGIVLGPLGLLVSSLMPKAAQAGELEDGAVPSAPNDVD